MKDFEYYEKKADSSEKLISDLEKFEIFNLECAEKYDSSQNIDFIIFAYEPLKVSDHETI